MTDAIDQYVTSLVNGRARLRHPALKGLDAETSESLRQAALAIEGVLDVTVNPRVGSLLAVWDPQVVGVEDLKAALTFGLQMLDSQEACEACACEAGESDADETSERKCCCAEKAKSCVAPAVNAVAKAGNTVLDQAAKVMAPNVANVRRARRLAQNRLMLAAGVSTVASLAFKTGWHAYLGWAFTLFLAAHLYQHRTVL